jgi:glycosyltransferase involved in cell wall biosynthesis
MTAPTAPLVSIITPVLNREGMIRRCLASVARQSHVRLEHIVVDGGSTDGTLDIVSSFDSPHALRWTTGPDQGMYDAINKGLGMARGTVLAYLNSDDLYLPWSVEVAVRALRGSHDVVYGDLGVLAAGRSRPRFSVQFYPRFDRKHFTYEAALGQPTVFWTRDVTDRIGLFDESFKLIGDCEYWLRAARAGMSFRHVSEILAVQAEHGGTLRSMLPEMIDKEWNILRSTYADWAGRPRPRWLVRLVDGLTWRYRQMQFVAAAQRAAPKGWSMFLAWIGGQGIRVPASGLLWYPLPRQLRPRHLRLLEAESFERALSGLLGPAESF